MITYILINHSDTGINYLNDANFRVKSALKRNNNTKHKYMLVDDLPKASFVFNCPITYGRHCVSERDFPCAQRTMLLK